MVWATVVTALIGVWFIIAPWALGFTSHVATMTTSIIGGAILLVLGGMATVYSTAFRESWLHILNAAVGVWFAIAPWVLSESNRTGTLWTSLLGGLVIVILGTWLATEASAGAIRFKPAMFERATDRMTAQTR
jgi:SPW repeat